MSNCSCARRRHALPSCPVAEAFHRAARMAMPGAFRQPFGGMKLPHGTPTSLGALRLAMVVALCTFGTRHRCDVSAPRSPCCGVSLGRHRRVAAPRRGSPYPKRPATTCAPSQPTMRGVAAEGASTLSFGLVGPRSALRAADAPPCSSLLSGCPPRLDKTHGATPAAAGLEDAAGAEPVERRARRLGGHHASRASLDGFEEIAWGGADTLRDAREAPGDDPTRTDRNGTRDGAASTRVSRGRAPVCPRMAAAARRILRCGRRRRAEPIADISPSTDPTENALAAPYTPSTREAPITETSLTVVAGSARRHRPFGRMLGGASTKGVVLKRLPSTDEKRVWRVLDESIDHGDPGNESTWRNEVVDALGERAHTNVLELQDWDFGWADEAKKSVQPIEFKIVSYRQERVVGAIAGRCSVSNYGLLDLKTKDLNNMLGAEYLLNQSAWLDQAERERWIGDGKEVALARVEVEQADGMPLVFLDPGGKRLAYMSTKALGRLVGSEHLIRNGFRKVRFTKSAHVHFTASTSGDHVFYCKHPGFVDGDEEGEELGNSSNLKYAFYDIRILVKPDGQLRRIQCQGTLFGDKAISFNSVDAFENHREVKARDLSFDGIGERLMYVNLNISTQSPLYLGTLSHSSDRLAKKLDDALALDNFRDADDELSLKFPVEVLTGYDVKSMRDTFDISYDDFQRKHQRDEWGDEEREFIDGFLCAPV
jgi:hypothetical protein